MSYLQNKNRIQKLSFVLSTFLVLARNDPDPEPSVVFSPLLLKMPAGESRIITCLYSGPGNASSISWFSPEGSIITKRTSDSIYSTYEGVLYFTGNASVNQSGDYNCSATYTAPVNASTLESIWTTFTVSGTVPVSIYVMPTYLKEGLIILGVNVVLAGVFVTYSAKSMMEDRKRLKQFEKQ